ncbi:MAG: HAMP domain-containing sensor histidine kinase [Oscillospiraceae bacterium]|jgi:signal transduction histidine kinase|nr:HAMP domain-containing sensor histidine kinase [Oscillospiraceae bacterium]
MNSLYKRQFALTAGLILFSFLLLGTSFLTLSYRYTLEEKQKALERYAMRVSDYTENYLASGRSVQAYQDNVYWDMLDFFAEYSDSYLVLSDAEGRILCSTDGQTSNYYKDSRVPYAITQAILTQGEFSGNSTLDGLFPQMEFVVGKPVIVGDYVAGMIFAAADITSVTAMWRTVVSIFFITAVVVLCISFVSTSVTSLRQTKPLKEMAAATRKFSHGEFDVRVDGYGRKDEIGELAEAFNAMAKSLEQAEARRQEFVANISHELKTPMTTIAGFANGILDGTIPSERIEPSLHIISDETRRLSRLVRQMLDVSQLQSQMPETRSMTAFDIVEVMRRVLVSLEPKISAKHLDVEANLPEEPLLVWGKMDDITRVGYNLLDNAIKFSAEGGLIGLNIHLRGGKAYISVRNPGEISQEEIPFIFDRFHKTDHSRSIDREGVGLGLYIVKTILNSRNETITVKSENGAVEFTFTLTCAMESDFGRDDSGRK